MKTYQQMSIEDAWHTSHGTYVELHGRIERPRITKNGRGNNQYYADLIGPSASIQITSFESDYERCALISGSDDYVAVRGRIKADGDPIVQCDAIASIETKIVPIVDTGNTSKMNEAEMLFVRTQSIHGDYYIVDHVQMFGREIDFVVYRKSDGKPVCGFEVDGDQHRFTRISDLARDVELEAKAGFPIKRIEAAEVFATARKKGLIE